MSGPRRRGRPVDVAVDEAGRPTAVRGLDDGTRRDVVMAWVVLAARPLHGVHDQKRASKIWHQASDARLADGCPRPETREQAMPSDT